MNAHHELMQQYGLCEARFERLREMLLEIQTLNAEYATLELSYQASLEKTSKNPYMSKLLTHKKFMQNIASDLGYMRLQIITRVTEYKLCLEFTDAEMRRAEVDHAISSEHDPQNPRSSISVEELLNPLPTQP